MKQDRYEEGRFTQGGRGLGTVTEEMVRQRAGELAVINGRTEDQILDSDLEEAHRELTSERVEPELSAEEQIVAGDNVGVPASTGDRVEAVPAPDEQTFAEKLVQEGVEDAEHDQMIQATREAQKRDTRLT
jgi:hypothetical protein